MKEWVWPWIFVVLIAILVYAHTDGLNYNVYHMLRFWFSQKTCYQFLVKVNHKPHFHCLPRIRADLNKPYIRRTPNLRINPSPITDPKPITNHLSQTHHRSPIHQPINNYNTDQTHQPNKPISTVQKSNFAPSTTKPNHHQANPPQHWQATTKKNP